MMSRKEGRKSPTLLKYREIALEYIKSGYKDIQSIYHSYYPKASPASLEVLPYKLLDRVRFQKVLQEAWLSLNLENIDLARDVILCLHKEMFNAKHSSDRIQAASWIGKSKALFIDKSEVRTTADVNLNERLTRLTHIIGNSNRIGSLLAKNGQTEHNRDNNPEPVRVEHTPPLQQDSAIPSQDILKREGGEGGMGKGEKTQSPPSESLPLSKITSESPSVTAPLLEVTSDLPSTAPILAPVPKAKESLMTGYCLKCKSKKEISEPVEVVMKNKMKALKGKCPDCTTVIFKILGKANA